MEMLLRAEVGGARGAYAWHSSSFELSFARLGNAASQCTDQCRVNILLLKCGPDIIFKLSRTGSSSTGWQAQDIRS